MVGKIVIDGHAIGCANDFEPALHPGDLVKAEVYEAGDYDLVARRV